jgi:hypothetical protein
MNHKSFIHGRLVLACVMGIILGGCAHTIPSADKSAQVATPAALSSAAPVSSRNASIDDHEMGGGKAAGFAPGSTASWDKADPGIKAKFTTEYESIKDDDDRPVYAKYLPLLGVDAILDYLEMQNPMCHGVAHNLGKELYTQTKDINGALQSCGNRCTGGCMHGVVGEAFGSQSHENVADKMEAFCSQGEMARLHKAGNCAHAMGHALMLSNGGELGESLESCSNFKQPGMDYYCATGVFMQYEMFLAEGVLDLEQKTLYSPCDEHSQYPAACYRYMMYGIADRLDHDIPKIIDACLALPDAFKRGGCLHGLGNQHTRKIAEDPDLLPRLCSQGSADEQAMCIEGAIEKLADFDEQSGMRACAKLNGANAETCRAAARHKMYSLDKPTLKLYRPAVKASARGDD